MQLKLNLCTENKQTNMEDWSNHKQNGLMELNFIAKSGLVLISIN